MRIRPLLILALVSVSACAPDTLPEPHKPAVRVSRPFPVAPRPPCDPALIAAVEKGRTDEIRRLAASGSHVTCGAQQYPTLLSDAIHRDAPDLVQTLLEAGADPNARWRVWGDRFPLQDALEADIFGFRSEHQVEIVRLLLAHGANPNARWCPFESRSDMNPNGTGLDMCVSEEGTAPLAVAVWIGNPEIVAMLLDAGADATSTDWRQMTPLDYLRDSAVASVLLPRVFPDEATRDAAALRAMEGCKGCWWSPANQTPLGRALTGWWGVRDPERPPPPSCLPGQVRGCISPSELARLRDAWVLRGVDRVSIILDLGADPNERFTHAGVDWPPIALASGGALEALLDHGARADARWCVPTNDWSWRPKPVGPMPGCTLDRGVTRLMKAAEAGNLGDVKMLLAHGADATLKDWEGRTAADYARASGHASVVAILLGPRATVAR